MNVEMSRRGFLAGLGAAGLAVMLPEIAGAAEGDANARPNFVLCMTDDQGWGDVSYNGLTKCKTPVLDEMAASGLRFDRFYAAHPVCSPTRGSVLTGRHPCRYGTLNAGAKLRIEEQTIAQALKSAGYTTAHFGKWHLNGVTREGKPVMADDPLSPGQFGFDEWFSVSNYFELDWTFARNGTSTEQVKGDGSVAIVEEALKFIDRAIEKKQPFLAVVWFGSPHNPHQPEPEDQKAGGSKYHGEIIGVDRAMGILREGLRKRGIAGNTLLHFCSDNGPEGPGSTGGMRGKKGTIWEGGVRVPGIIEWPDRIPKPMVSDVPVVTSDLYPTLVELAGAKVENQIRPLDGISLVPLLDGKMAERPEPIGFWMGTSGIRNSIDVGHAALTDNRYKLHKLSADKYELYDLVEDRTESKDIAAGKPEVVEKMKQQLKGWQESVVKSLGRGDYEPGTVKPKKAKQ